MTRAGVWSAIRLRIRGDERFSEHFQDRHSLSTESTGWKVKEVIQSKKNVIRLFHSFRSFDWSVVHSRYYSQVSQFIVRENDHSVQ